ncbi:MAG: hypothetical protein PHT91_03695 [Candidatus Nanoarchaeia archaeon]|nr:hypothetical protein [Candidatus Nanoarchaeia archaeon]MDD5499947.1 hypothetical protein [Candidatus Nanoarchaeia archaeon]
MKIFRKTHFWKDNRTFIEIDAEEPGIERGYPAEGSFLLKIGEQSSIKSAFKLSPDEARAMRDAFDAFLKIHDKKHAELMSNDYEKKEYNPYEKQEYSSSLEKNDYSASQFDKKEYNKDEYEFRPEYGKEDYSHKPEYTKMPQDKQSDSSFFIFGNDSQPKKEEKKPNVEFYF